MKIISERQRVTRVEYSRDFDDGKGAGYSFSCDKDGNLSQDLSEESLKNYQDCIEGKHLNLYDIGIRKWENSYTDPAVGICEKCGKEVSLSDDYCSATECECGEWYTMNGQNIYPPEMWEEPIEEDY